MPSLAWPDGSPAAQAMVCATDRQTDNGGHDGEHRQAVGQCSTLQPGGTEHVERRGGRAGGVCSAGRPNAWNHGCVRDRRVGSPSPRRQDPSTGSHARQPVPGSARPIRRDRFDCSGVGRGSCAPSGVAAGGRLCRRPAYRGPDTAANRHPLLRPGRRLDGPWRRPRACVGLGILPTVWDRLSI